MTALQKGANAPLPSTKLVVVVSHQGPDTDLSALLLTAAGKVRNDQDLVFYGETRSVEGSVEYLSKDNVAGGYRHELSIAPPVVPAEIDKIALTLTIDAETKATFATVTGLVITVFEEKDGKREELLTINPEGSTETALILAEVYRRQGAWKIRHVAQGFNNGLSGIATMYGITVLDDEPEAAPPPPPPPPPPAPKLTLAKPAPVGKISLAKGKTIDISKGAAITATGSWQNKGRKKLDYDLFCHIAYRDGRREVVNFDRLLSSNSSVRHHGDLKVGGVGTVEKVTVNLTDDIACVGFSFYSARENGSGSFADAQAQVSLDNGEGSTVTIPVTQMSVDANQYTLYFGTVHNRGEFRVEISAHEDYSRRGSESQVRLDSDGTHHMDKGPENRYK